ncbi:MAG: AtpZ/AtpI family protein [bacterium]|nr:AtpZ/AtpI family protein [bacterium]
MTKKSNFKTFYAISLAWQLGFFIVAPISGFLYLGLLVDNYLSTKPIFLLIGMLIGIIITIYEVYHLLIPLIKDGEKNA